METRAERAAAIVEACDRALERLADVVYPEIEPLRRSIAAFREDARRVQATDAAGPAGLAA